MLQVITTLITLASLQSPGWHKVKSENTFDSVAVTRELHNDIIVNTQSAEFWGNIGPQAVFRAWNSSAYDPEENILYFHGGGHSDYGGNEIYAYNINSLTWSRLTEPSLLLNPETHSKVESKTVYLPLDGPISAHTYDAFVWNPATKSIWTSSAIGFGGGNGSPPHAPKERAMWEFSPSTKEWHKHQSSNHFYYPMAVYLPQSQRILIVSHQGSTHSATLFEKDGTEQVLGKIEGLNASGISSIFSNPETSEIYSSHKQGIFKIEIVESSISATKVTSYPSLDAFHYQLDYSQASFNYRPQDGKFYIWNGGQQMMTWSPESNSFDVVWNDYQNKVPSHQAKGVGRVFDKFIYLAQEDLFLGLTNAGSAQQSDGMWAWRPFDEPEPPLHLAEFGDIQIDGTTQTSASFFVPIIAGDRNYNASVEVRYRVQGTSEWNDGIELLRIRPEFTKNSKNSTGISAEGFAGIVTGLHANTKYEFTFSMFDADQKDSVITKQVSANTLNVKDNLRSINLIEVTNAPELHDALKSAKPGDTIKLMAGTYKGKFTIKNSGTANMPITITGITPELTKIDATGESVGVQIDADHIIVTNLNIAHAKTGIYLRDEKRTDVAIISNHIEDVDVGVAAKGGHFQLYIHDNLLEGRAAFADVSRATWSLEGIVVTGKNIEISHNTLSGFGDSIGMHWRSNLANLSINIHHNLILWGGDDGIEFDFSLRNVSAHHNLISNTANGLSFQPVWGGPAIAHHNIVLNPGRGPIKIKPEKDNPSGILIYHNTFIKDDSEITGGGDEAWRNTGGQVKQLFVFNNLFVSPNDATNYILNNATSHDLSQLDHNGWTADGRFTFKLVSTDNSVRANNFEEWLANGKVGMHDRLLDLNEVFSTYQPNFEKQQFTHYRSPYDAKFALNLYSPAVDAGKAIFGITSNYKGQAPDLGALEVGSNQPIFGASLKRTMIDTFVANDDIFNMQINTTAIFSPLDNDIAPLGETLQLASVDTPTNGTISLINDKQFEFTPNANFVGHEQLTYKATDSDNNIIAGNILIRVNLANRSPQAESDSFDLKQGHAITIKFSKLLENDFDPDGDQISIVKIGNTKYGTLRKFNDAIHYQPQVGFAGNDAVYYQIKDSQGLTSRAKIVFKVTTANTIIGSEYRDYINVSDRSKGVTILGNGGADIIVGTQGDDIINGGPLEDKMNGGLGDDIFLYEDYDGYHDWVDGGAGYNQIVGDHANNIIGLHQVSNIATINGQGGTDIIMGGKYRQEFDFSATELKSIELIDGGDGEDLIIGSQASDNIKGSSKDDYIDGQEGVDTAFFDNAITDYNINIVGEFTYVKALDSEEGIDTLINIEVLQFMDQRMAL